MFPTRVLSRDLDNDRVLLNQAVLSRDLDKDGVLLNQVSAQTSDLL